MVLLQVWVHSTGCCSGDIAACISIFTMIWQCVALQACQLTLTRKAHALGGVASFAAMGSRQPTAEVVFASWSSAKEKAAACWSRPRYSCSFCNSNGGRQTTTSACHAPKKVSGSLDESQQCVSYNTGKVFWI